VGIRSTYEERYGNAAADAAFSLHYVRRVRRRTFAWRPRGTRITFRAMTKCTPTFSTLKLQRHQYAVSPDAQQWRDVDGGSALR
jgi:hypothetical protein